MDPYTKSSDEGLALARKVGLADWKKKKRVSKRQANLGIVAKAKPDELDNAPEADIRAVMRMEIESEGLPYVSFEEELYHWLRGHANRGTWQAITLLGKLSSLPDLLAWKRVEGKSYSLAFICELKRRRGGVVSPGQQDFIDKAGGSVARGLVEAKKALGDFLEAVKTL